MTSSSTNESRARLSAAIQQLGSVHGSLAVLLANVSAIVAEEATQNASFAARLNAVLIGDGQPALTVAPAETRPSPTAAASAPAPAKAPSRRGRRAPGPWDPFDVYAEVGETGLTDRLNQLELEQLRNIIAEHGMNSDGLALKWRKADKVVGRIVERVVDRSAKGDAFRGA